MIVQCPSCASRYRIRDANIPPSGGKIRCPSCSHSFIVYPEASDDGADATNVTSQGEISQLVNQMGNQGQGPSAADEDYVQTQVADGNMDQYRAMQARKQELGDPMDMDGTVEIKNPMDVWKEAQQAMQNARANAAEPDDPTGDDYDHAPTEVVNPADLDFAQMHQGGAQPPSSGAATYDDDPTFTMDDDVADRARARGDSGVGIDPAGNGSGMHAYAQNTPPSGRAPSGGQSTQGSGFNQDPGASGLQSSDLFDQPLDEAATLQGDGNPPAQAAAPDGSHPGPWKLKTNFGLTYEFPDTRSLNSWLSSREDLDGYTVSADDGASYLQLSQFPQLEIGGSGQQSMPSGNFSVPPSHGSGLTQAPSQVRADSSPSIDRPSSVDRSPPSQSSPGDDPFRPPSNPQPPSQGQPGIKGPRVNTEFRPPSRESKYQGLLWSVFFILLLVAVGVGVHTFGIFDVVGAFNQHVLGKAPQPEEETEPEPEREVETPPATTEKLDEEEARKQQEREVEGLLEDARRLIDGNKLPAALEKLETTLQVAPKNPRVYDMMADVHERLGQADKAEEAEARANELRGEAAGPDAGDAADEEAAEEEATDEEAPDSKTE